MANTYSSHLALLSALMIILLCGNVGPTQAQERPGPPDFCPDGLHKQNPSPETESLGICSLWQSNSCCTPETMRIIETAGDIGLYNFSWELCGPLSQQCRTFMEREACFFECEPMMGYFRFGAGIVRNVPVCASYCNMWFEACKDDRSCVSNWLASFQQALSEGENTCPAGAECRTFTELFGDGKGLCDMLWDSAYFYSEDEDNCTVMTFDPNMPNPNNQLTFGSGERTVVQQASAVMVVSIALILLHL